MLGHPGTERIKIMDATELLQLYHVLNALALWYMLKLLGVVH